MDFLRDFLICAWLTFFGMMACQYLDRPETLGHWLSKVDAARYEGLPIDVN